MIWALTWALSVFMYFGEVECAATEADPHGLQCVVPALI